MTGSEQLAGFSCVIRRTSADQCLRIPQDPEAALRMRRGFRISQHAVDRLNGLEVPRLVRWLGCSAEHPYGAAVSTWLEGVEVSPATATEGVARLLLAIRICQAPAAESFDRWWTRRIAEAQAGTALIEGLLDSARARQVREIVDLLDRERNHVQPGLIHGDLWFGNKLDRGGRLVGVLDWDDSAIGDPACDLAGLSYLGDDWAFAVFDQAGSNEAEVRRSRYWRVVRELDGVRWSVGHSDDHELAETLDKLSDAMSLV